MKASEQNYRVVNNSGLDIRDFDKWFLEASETGVLREELADVFSVRLLKGYNADGTNRLIVDLA